MLTGFVTTVVCLVPGGILGFAVPAGRERWAVWAAAPVLTLGLTSVAMAWLSGVGGPNSAQGVLILEILLALAAVAVARVLERRRVPDEPEQSHVRSAALIGAQTATGGRAGTAADYDVHHEVTAEMHSADYPPAELGWRARLHISLRHPRLPDLVAFGVPAVIAVGFGEHLLGSLADPPGWDAMNHGVLSRNILEAGSTAIDAACNTGSTAPAVSCAFYPLATNVNWAQGAVMSGGHISTAMLAWSTVVGPLALVAAVFVAVRLLGGRPVVAGCAALATVFLGPEWAALLTGRPTESFGPGMAVAVAVLATLALRGKYPIRLGLLAGLGIGGVMMMHTYDVLLGVSLVLVLAVVKPRTIVLRTVLQGLAGMVAGVLAALAPFGTALTSAGAERTAHPPAFIGHVGDAFQYWVLDFQRYVLLGYPGPDGLDHPQSHAVRFALLLTIPCLLASPLCFVFRALRWARPWVAAWVIWFVISMWTSTTNNAGAKYLASLWYGIRERERVMIGPILGVLAVAGACAIGLSVQVVFALLARRSWQVRPRPLAAAVTAVILAVSLVGLTTVVSTRKTLQTALARDAPVGTAYPRVFIWLKKHTPSGDVVAYDRHLEFMTWSYVNDGVPLLFGISPVTKGAAQTNQTEREQAWKWLVNGLGAEPAGCLVRKFKVWYVVVGRAYVPMAGKRTYSPARLAISPNVHLVHTDGGIKVYQVSDAGLACAAPA
ncbi:MAG: DUF6541 family protein [Jatrophihabitans sp.]